ncbi:uncharacterized protein LOC119303970 isoform X1 [Triticum dicoccoides]|uniref:uncharacterized protein LOC119303970 isoform X1 n=2 Tax=Triticum dicoccoides TaxID=85692 RepID=UPI00188E821E|nr:uncharacterized protein LOC119303970 isoform X1 [Triticum dicoccoides]XP_044383877.1 uncharacterized protein LOC123105796 isoform X1 [Triticum aestivum]
MGAIDLGNPLLNRTVDGFLKIGAAWSMEWKGPVVTVTRPEWGVGEAAGRRICVKATIERNKKANHDTSNSSTVAEVNAHFAILGEPGVLYGEAKQQPTTQLVTPDEGTTTHHDYPLEGLPSLHPAVRTEQGGVIVHTVELVEP